MSTVRCSVCGRFTRYENVHTRIPYTGQETVMAEPPDPEWVCSDCDEPYPERTEVALNGC